ncbi:citrate lyase subunit beta [Salmonella enterica subsp. enterica]|uniref:Citrate lyase subunit beta n=1 Tax=Salmonella enterica I TaxID=59201 RepID=A0A379VW54_SALET|nr:citrate lyase subunit beta [Salmonella enterica subsp. enterica]
MRPRRSMLFIPGANAAMLSTSFVYGADAVMFDLEDAVALREKDTARLLVHHALQHPFYQDVEKVVRINPLNTPFGLADLEAVVRGGADIVRLPKTDSKNDVLELEAQVERIERECGREVGQYQADGGDRISERRGQCRRHRHLQPAHGGNCAGGI